ncbi:MAG TPA: NAD(P)H-dependent oxidoreductase [Verrucomicrobiae bacterium]|nr:NAD(P)H-dependent oxidoreductase [Verrucomicrobiae bacterium]
METLKIFGFAGSLRKNSFNRSALRAAQELAPEGVKVETFELNGMPLYNEDDEASPAGIVTQFREKIAAADAILIATPEYNYSIPGVLKNAIDWASRPYGKGALMRKPVAIMGASPGMLGTARAQYDLRKCFVFLDMYCLNQPEVMIPFAAKAFDAEGNVADEKAREKIKQLVAALADWTRKLRKGGVL